MFSLQSIGFRIARLTKHLSSLCVFRTRSQIELFEWNAMSNYVLARQNAGSISATNRRRHKGLNEKHTTLCEAIQIGCLDVLVAHDAQAVLRLVIGKHNQQFGPTILRVQQAAQKVKNDRCEDSDRLFH